MKDEKLYTVSDLAELWQVKEDTIRRHIAAGRLAAYKIGGSVRVSRAAVDAFMRDAARTTEDTSTTDRR